MASTIKLKRGSGAPAASALVEGEPAFDLTNKRLGRYNNPHYWEFFYGFNATLYCWRSAYAYCR